MTIKDAEHRSLASLAIASWIVAGFLTGCAGRAQDLSPNPGGRAGAAARFESVAVGSAHTCAIRIPQRDVFCWGSNVSAQYGNGTRGLEETLNPPVLTLEGDAAKISNAAKVFAAVDRTCVIDTASALYCWGFFLEFSPLRLPKKIGPTDPHRPPHDAKFVGAALGWSDDGCASTGGGGVFCMGRGSDGQLGTGEEHDNLYDLTAKALIEDATGSIDAGTAFSCAVRRTGEVACWGSNSAGQAGVAATEKRVLAPHTLPGLGAVVQVATGTTHACALHSNGTVSCWGSNSQGQLGRGGVDMAAHPAPAAVDGLTGATMIEAAGYHTCAVSLDGALRCWGANANFGVKTNPFFWGDPPPQPKPVEVLPKGSAKSVAVGENHACVVTIAGTLRCWGQNDFGQLITGDTEPRAKP